jgi:hypothetical protein
VPIPEEQVEASVDSLMERNFSIHYHVWDFNEWRRINRGPEKDFTLGPE